MMNALQAVDVVYATCHSQYPNGDFNITGNIYKYQRPQDSNKEDFVINSLPMNNDALQYCIVNVNIHVPNLVLDFGGKIDNTQPNIQRLQQLTQAALFVLDENWHYSADYEFNVQQHNLMQDNDGSWYVNIRVEFRSVNL